MADLSSPTWTAWVQPVIKDRIQDKTASPMPNDVLRCSIKVLWFTVQKAADMSNIKSSRVTLPLSAALRMSETILRTAVSVLQCAM